MDTKKHALQICISLVIIFLVSSCSIFRKGSLESNAAIYQTPGNGVADIRMSLHPNGKFDYNMIVLPQPGTDETHDTIYYNGKWKTRNSDYLLKFKRRNQPDLQTLFSPGYTPKSEVKIADDREIQFPVADQEIHIWGITLDKLPYHETNN